MIGAIKPTKATTPLLYAPAKHRRRPRDAYSTPPELTRALVIGLRQAGLTLPTPVHDQCAGAGRLIDALNAHGVDCTGSDLYPGDYPPHRSISPRSFDATKLRDLADAIELCDARSLVTNPPYGRQANLCIQNACMCVAADMVGMAAFLLPLPWEAAASRQRVSNMRFCALRIVCCWRPEWIDGTGGGGKMNYVWLVWTHRPQRFPPTLPHTRSIYVSKDDR